MGFQGSGDLGEFRGPGTGTPYAAMKADKYNLVLTEAGTKNIIGGPFKFDFALVKNYGIVIVDASDITGADALIFDQTPGK